MANGKNITTMKLHKDTLKKLKKRGVMGDSCESVLLKLLGEKKGNQK